ncbi:hypothetical protein PCASD_11382 [Puccinia coronata f. sp. avenae]|uniref:RING-type domain-containing protein n=1 Tax=Puccinia coronata f. sp. avenae TaxID=200324 RepID=A0A2N5TDQ2_9BASI|nr:hypothetical protein PCASD_11382 [Puccinia coronata f. sp. avenae]
MPHILKLVVLLQVATSINAIPVGGQSSRSLFNCKNPFKSVTRSRMFNCFRSDPKSRSASLINDPENSGGTLNNTPGNVVGEAINEAERPAAAVMNDSPSSHLEASGGSAHYRFEQGTTSAQTSRGIDLVLLATLITATPVQDGIDQSLLGRCPSPIESVTGRIHSVQSEADSNPGSELIIDHPKNSVQTSLDTTEDSTGPVMNEAKRSAGPGVSNAERSVLGAPGNSGGLEQGTTSSPTSQQINHKKKECPICFDEMVEDIKPYPGCGHPFHKMEITS